MRCLLPALVLLAPAIALAGNGYAPKFARDEQQAQPLAVDLCPKPEYPKASLRNEEEGVVTYRFTIGSNGRVLRQQVVRSSGFPNLDRAARRGAGAHATGARTRLVRQPPMPARARRAGSGAARGRAGRTRPRGGVAGSAARRAGAARR
jgi:TonB family protein